MTNSADVTRWIREKLTVINSTVEDSKLSDAHKRTILDAVAAVDKLLNRLGDCPLESECPRFQGRKGP